jgi:hypothetical protein
LGFPSLDYIDIIAHLEPFVKCFFLVCARVSPLSCKSVLQPAKLFASKGQHLRRVTFSFFPVEKRFVAHNLSQKVIQSAFLILAGADGFNLHSSKFVAPLPQNNCIIAHGDENVNTFFRKF